MKGQPRAKVTHFRNSNFKYKMLKDCKSRKKHMYGKFYVHEIAAGNLSKIYFLKNAKKTCKPKKRDLNSD